MKYGVTLPPFGDFADPRFLAEAARKAESAGWDGFFIWDHVFFDPSFHPNLDPWVGLAAVAMATQQIRLGTLITPLARRRPWKVARETVSVDLLSDGRLTLGVGLGDPVQWDFGFFGEATDARLRAQRLDEGLEILNGLWTGDWFSYQGTHYQLERMVFQPRPVQQPRIPIWCGGTFPKRVPMRRAARYDGYMPLKEGLAEMQPDDWREAIAFIQSQRTGDAPFDFVHGGATPGDDRGAAVEKVAAYAEAGVTWWVEALDPWRFGASWEDAWQPKDTANMMQRIEQGPPKE